ncbi:MAG: SUMF1/EgtB/PvdO family nonheme iron enzyme [Polyangiaceae bacterium]
MFTALAVGCSGKSGGHESAPSSSDQQRTSSEIPGAGASAIASPAGTTASSAGVTLAAASAGASDAPPATYPGSSRGCPNDMVRVEGEYCPAVTQTCKRHHQEYDASPTSKTVSERCMEYEVPSRCVSKTRSHLAFCMDRFEYPNKVGELPHVLWDWYHARDKCKELGKRLCTEDEFNFACEGPEMLPYVYGYVRNPEICNFDKPYRFPDRSHHMKQYDECPSDPFCKGELERLDQREPIGQRTTCVSWAGVFDLNGNVNEWVFLPKEKPPNRSGLKGGWWGPIRARCRPTVTFHKESDFGYEAGFRCCKDAAEGNAE